MASVSRTTTIYGSGADRIDLIFTATEIQVLSDTNQSRVKVSLIAEFHGTYNTGLNISTEAFVSVGGVKVGRRTSGSSAQYYLEGGQWRIIDGATVLVNHNADGTKSVSCYGSINGRTTSTATLTLSTIKLLGTGSFSPNPAIVNTTDSTTAMTLTVTPRNGNYYHYVQISTGGAGFLPNRGWAEDNAFTFVVTNANITGNSANANTASGNVRAVIRTFDEKVQDPDTAPGNLVGTTTVYGPWIIDTSAVHPNIVVGTVDPVNSSIPNVIVAGYSAAKVNISGLPGFGTTVTGQLTRGSIASINITGLTTDTLPASENDYTVTATINARDGRGATDQKQTTFTVKGYKRPKARLIARRVASNGSTTYDEAGQYVYVAWSNEITALGANAVQSESVTYSGDISGTLTTNPSWVALTESQGATFTYTVTDLVTTGTAEKSVPVAIFPLDLFQSGSNVGAAFGGVAVAGIVRSFLPFAGQLPVVLEDTASATLDTRSGILTRAHYNGTQTLTIPDGTSSGWYAVVVRSRNQATNFVCSGSDGLIVSGESSIPTSYSASGLGTYLIVRVAGTRLALCIDVGTGGGGGGSVTWNDITGKPSFAAVATSGDYDDLTDKPSLATVATSGDYDDLTDKPTIPAQGQMWFGTSSTAGGTATKAVTITGFPNTLTDGMTVAVRFANANTVASPKLSINSGTAVAIRRYGSTAPSTSAATSWQAGTVVLMVYYDGYWYIANWLNTTYSEISAANVANTTSSTTGLITGRRFKAGFDALLTSTAITTELGFTPQSVGNLVTSVSSASTDAQYPSAKLFYDTVGDIETLLQALR